MSDSPPYTADRFMRCARKYVAARATAIRATTVLELRMSAALAAYWERETRKVTQ